MAQSISVIVPAYNEEENIEETVRACQRVLPNLIEAYEIIVVNDGSSDNTGKKADELAKSIPSLKVYHHAQNKGMGAAVQTGIANSKNELIFPVPADLQFDIRELEKFLALIHEADIVIGYRVQRDYSLYRRFITFVNHTLLNLMFGVRVKDASWVKLFRKNVFDSLAITSPRFFWEAEVLIKARLHHLKIQEVETHSYPRRSGVSSGGKPISAIKSFFALLGFWFKLRNKTFLLFIAFALLVFLFYGKTLGNGFIYDDKQQVQENKYIQSLRYLPKVVTGCTWEYAFGQCKGRALYYRPIQSLSYLLTYQISSAPWVFHAANLVYFLAVVLLIFLLAKTLGSNDLFAFVAAFLFLIHPANSEVVNWIAAVPDLTLAMFALLSAIFYLRYRREPVIPHGPSLELRKPASKIVSPYSSLRSEPRPNPTILNAGFLRFSRKLFLVYLFYFLALLAKEPAVLLPLLFIFVDFAFFKKKIADFLTLRELKIYLGFSLLLAVSLAMRIMALGSLAPQGATPFATFSLGERIASAFHLFAQYLGKLFFPHPLLFFYSFEKKSDFFSFEFLGALLSLLAFFAAAIFLWKKARFVAVFSLFWIFLFLAPVLLFLDSLGESVFAERYLFLPAIGFTLALSSLFLYGWKNTRTTGKILLASVVCVVSVASFSIIHERNKEFRNNEALYEKTLNQNPKAYPIRFNWAVFLRNDKGDFEAAKQEFETLVQQNPNWGDMGMVYLHLGDYYRDTKQDTARALEYYEKSGAASGNVWKAYFAYDRIGGIFATKEEYLKALPYFCKAVQIYPEAQDASARFDRIVSLITSTYKDKPSVLYQGVKEAFRKTELEGVRYGRTWCDEKNCSHLFSLRFEGKSEIILPFLIMAAADSGKIAEITNSAFNPNTSEVMLQTDASWQDTKLTFIFPTCDGVYYEVSSMQ